MQYTEILKIDENGKTLENIEVNFVDILVILYKIDNYQEKYPWIATVDPYGNTVFNRIQVPLVINDLNKLKEENLELRDIINKLINFFERVEIHEYIKFMGD